MDNSIERLVTLLLADRWTDVPYVVPLMLHWSGRIMGGAGGRIATVSTAGCKTTAAAPVALAFVCGVRWDLGVRTFISCNPWECMPDDLLMESGKLVGSNGARVAMYRHSIVGVENGLAVEMNYAGVLLVDWRRQLVN